MKLTLKQLKCMIRECLANPMVMSDEEGALVEPEVELKVSEPEMRAGLFPGMSSGGSGAVLGDERDKEAVDLGDQLASEPSTPFADTVIKLADKASEIKQLAEKTKITNTTAINEEIKAATALLESVGKRLVKGA